MRRSTIVATSARAMARKSAAEREGCPVEVAVRREPAVIEHDGVVDGRGELVAGDRLDVLQRVPGRSVHLGRAAHGVRVLDSGVVVAVRRDDGRAGEERPQVGRAHLLARLGPQGHDVGSEGLVGAEEALHAHRPGQVGGVQEATGVEAGQHEHAEHPVGPVDQREPFLGLELQRGHAAGGERGAPVHDIATDLDEALAEQHEGDVGQGSEVATAAERAVLGHDGCEAAVQQVDELFGQHGRARRCGPSPTCAPAGGSSPAPPRARRAGPCRRRAIARVRPGGGAGPRAAMWRLAIAPKPVETP